MIKCNRGFLQASEIQSLSNVEKSYHAAVTVVANRLFGTHIVSEIPIPKTSYPHGGVIVGGSIVHVDRTRVFVVTGVTFGKLRVSSDCYREAAVCCALEHAYDAFSTGGCNGLKKLIGRLNVTYGETDRPLRALMSECFSIKLA